MRNVLPKNNAGETFTHFDKAAFVGRTILLCLWTAVVMGVVWYWFCRYGFQSWARTTWDSEGRIPAFLAAGAVLFVIFLLEALVGVIATGLEPKPKRLENMPGVNSILIVLLAWAFLSLLLNGQGFFWFCGGMLVVALGTACIAADERRYRRGIISNWCRGGAFKYRPDLVKFTIPEGVTFIGNEAFLGCPNLVSVQIPDSVIRIGYDAFKDCPHLQFDDVQDNHIFSVDGWIVQAENLSGDVVLSGFRGISDGSEAHAVFQNCKMTSVEIKDTMIRIGTCAFGFYIDSSHWVTLALKRLTIPKSVRSIGQCVTPGRQPFGTQTSLEEIDVSDLKAWCNITFDGGPSLQSEHFLIGGMETTSINIPDTISQIRPWSFACQNGIRSVTIPDSVTSIGAGAFSGCSSLQSVVFSDNVKIIGENAFYGCSNLQSVVFSDNVKIIGEHAFYGCSNLMLVHLPKHLKRIDGWAFACCPKLVITAFPKGVKIHQYAFDKSPNVLNIPWG